MLGSALGVGSLRRHHSDRWPPECVPDAARSAAVNPQKGVHSRSLRSAPDLAPQTPRRDRKEAEQSIPSAHIPGGLGHREHSWARCVGAAASGSTSESRDSSTSRITGRPCCSAQSSRLSGRLLRRRSMSSAAVATVDATNIHITGFMSVHCSRSRTLRAHVASSSGAEKWLSRRRRGKRGPRPFADWKQNPTPCVRRLR